MKSLLILPLAIPFAGTALSLLAWHQPRLQRRLALAGTLLLLASACALLAAVRAGGILVLQIGDWPAPHGITLVADLFSAIMVLMAAVVGLSVTVYSVPSIGRRREAFGYYALLQVLLLGVCGAFLAGDLFNLYVWFEVMLIASFVLISLGGERNQIEGALKYLTLNLLSSAFFLSAVGILYGATGTLNLADLAQKLNAGVSPGLRATLAMLFLVAFGIKAAAFPFFFWLPASYHTPPVAVTVLFSGLLTKVGVYSIFRIFTLVFVNEGDYLRILLLVMAGLTMVTGVLGAVAQYEFRRLLAFHIVSQIGYMLMAVGLFSPLALGGGVYFIVHVILAKSALFFVSGVSYHVRGTSDLKKLGGLYTSHPALSLAFLLPAFSLAGVPPLSGFFGKLTLIRAALELGQGWIVAVALGVSILTFYSMLKIWNEAFLKPDPHPDSPAVGRNRTPALLFGPTAALVLGSLALGLSAPPAVTLALEAGAQLRQPQTYVRAVLGRER
ncbi:MAG: Na+/H+ antiporter subunit D [Armatimonadota bacterium]